MGTIYLCTKFYLNVESSFKVICQTRYRTDAKYAFPFYQTVFFIICKMYSFDQYFWLEITNTYTTKQSITCFHIVC